MICFENYYLIDDDIQWLFIYKKGKDFINRWIKGLNWSRKWANERKRITDNYSVRIDWQVSQRDSRDLENYLRKDTAIHLRKR